MKGGFKGFNTANAATNSSFNQLFDNGAIILGYYRIFTNFGDLPGPMRYWEFIPAERTRPSIRPLG